MIIEFSLLDHFHGHGPKVAHLPFPGLLALLAKFDNGQFMGLGPQIIIFLHGAKVGLGQFGGHVRNIVQVPELVQAVCLALRFRGQPRIEDLTHLRRNRDAKIPMDKPAVQVHHPSFHLGEHIPQAHGGRFAVHAILFEGLGEKLMLLFGPGLALLGPDKGRSDSVAAGVVKLHKPLHDMGRFVDRRGDVRAFKGVDDCLHVVNPFGGAAGLAGGGGLIPRLDLDILIREYHIIVSPLPLTPARRVQVLNATDAEGVEVFGGSFVVRFVPDSTIGPFMIIAAYHIREGSVKIPSG